MHIVILPWSNDESLKVTLFINYSLVGLCAHLHNERHRLLSRWLQSLAWSWYTNSQYWPHACRECKRSPSWALIRDAPSPDVDTDMDSSVWRDWDLLFPVCVCTLVLGVPSAYGSLVLRLQPSFCRFAFLWGVPSYFAGGLDFAVHHWIRLNIDPAPRQDPSLTIFPGTVKNCLGFFFGCYSARIWCTKL